MGNFSSRKFRIALGASALALLLTAFQNCGVGTNLGEMKANNSRQAAGLPADGNGEGYGGKTKRFYHGLAPCTDGKASSILERRGEDFYLLRDNCAEISEVLIARGTVENLMHAQDLALFDNRVYKTTFATTGSTTGGCTPSPGVSCDQPGRNVIARHFCRGSDTHVAYPRKVVDIFVDLDASAKSISDVTIADYAAPETLAGPAFSRKVNSNVTVTMGASGPVQNYIGALGAGESYNLALDTLKNANLNYALGTQSGVNQSMKCYLH